jgi:5-methylcytosine-specific restriction protein A
MPILTRHKEQTAPRREDPYRHIYQSARWHNFSRNYLKTNRLCAECLKKGVTSIAKQVDHIVPLKIWIPQGGDPYDLINLQPLDKSCHSKKTAEENKGWNKMDAE